MRMTDEATEATRLRSAGFPVVLADGEKHHVRYDFAALEVLERTFGTVTEALEQARTGRYGPLGRLVMAGLAHEGLTWEEHNDLLVVGDSRLYLEVTSDAIAEAFPAPAKEKPGKAGRGNAKGETPTTTADSPGPASTTPPPSPSDDPTGRSGG